ncbi:MAG: ATP-binding protein [Planctomycetota bacterium]|jgi:signal transduction histidine kinase
MAKTELTELIVSGPKASRKIALDKKEVTIGRGANCDVILDNDTVSRLHARMSHDPFGRWILEDASSHNGVFVGGQRVRTHVVSPGELITIEPFTLSVSVESSRNTITGTSLQSSISLIDRGLEENIISKKSSEATILSPALVQHLNKFTTHLLKLSSPSQLYSEACSFLAETFRTLVAIVRVQRDSESLSDSPDILACGFGEAGGNTAVVQPFNLRLSKKVLEAVCSSDAPVMARSAQSAEKHLMLTVVDESSPHVVFAARVNEFDENIDALYLDVLESRSSTEMFDFVQAVARQINFMQKNLFFIELQKQEKALRQANMQLKEKDRIKDEYVSRVTHDIKGHLAAIQSCLFVAGSESTGALNAKQSDFLGRSVRRTTQLTSFVKELLNLTQMRLSGQIQMEEFSLADSISKALATVVRKADDKSITVTSNVELGAETIIGDEFSINEMLTNLLFNAIKYTPEGKTVHLEAKSCDTYFQVDISDTGIGIPAEELGSIFDEFFRASNAKNSEKDGTGLGLSIVKQIIARHGGEITAESEEGRGTTFSIILPKNKPL